MADQDAAPAAQDTTPAADDAQDQTATLVTEPAEAQPAQEPKTQDAPAEPKTPAAEEPSAPEAAAVDATKLAIPDGSLLDEGDRERIAAFAREQGLSQEQAQALLTREHDELASAEASEKAQVQEAGAAWRRESEEDPEIGGEKLPAVAESARRAFDRYATPGLREFLKRTGLGNNKEVLKTFSAIGKAMGDDTLVTGAPGGTPQKDVADVFFPNRADYEQE